MKFIGITGGVGSGKSEILKYIKKHYKCEIYLADEVAHLVQEPGTACFEKLVKLLGKEVLGKDGRIDKAAMAEKIFADAECLRQVNEIVHPAVKTFLLEKLALAGSNEELEMFFVEAALLIECGYGKLTDEMWYVFAKEEVRLQRLMANRGYSKEKAEAIMAKQLSEEQFREACNFVIDNSGSLEESCRQIDKKLEAFTWQE